MHSDNLQMIEEISGTNVIATLGKGDKNLNLRYQKMEDYFDEC